MRLHEFYTKYKQVWVIGSPVQLYMGCGGEPRPSDMPSTNMSKDKVQATDKFILQMYHLSINSANKH